MELIMQIMSYPFMVRAFIVGILVSLCAALLRSEERRVGKECRL